MQWWEKTFYIFFHSLSTEKNGVILFCLAALLRRQRQTHAVRNNKRDDYDIIWYIPWVGGSIVCANTFFYLLFFPVKHPYHCCCQPHHNRYLVTFISFIRSIAPHKRTTLLCRVWTMMIDQQKICRWFPTFPSTYARHWRYAYQMNGKKKEADGEVK